MEPSRPGSESATIHVVAGTLRRDPPALAARRL